MAAIVLTDDQSRFVQQAGGDVVVRDSAGRSLGVLVRTFDGEEGIRLSAAEFDEIVRRMNDADPGWSTTEQVLSRLHAQDA